MKYIHKLPFGVPQGVSAINLSALESIVADVYREMKQDESSLMAYNGGHYGSDLLANLDIPAVNLENFGCPKVEIIINHLVWLETCGRHTAPNAYAHCPKVEVEAMGQWIQDILER